MKRIPISRLKIDVEFVRDLGFSQASRQVIEAAVALAKGFLLETVAEGVEDEESAALLAQIGVSHVQGFHHSRPRPVGELVEPSSSDQLHLCPGEH
ncbi:MAG: EAL domain-containing protein [Solirubrobacterales bacterium]